VAIMAPHRKASEAHAAASLFFFLAFVRRGIRERSPCRSSTNQWISVGVCSDLVQPPPLRKGSTRFGRSGSPIWLPLGRPTTSMDVPRCPARSQRRYGLLLWTKRHGLARAERRRVVAGAASHVGAWPGASGDSRAWRRKDGRKPNPAGMRNLTRPARKAASHHFAYRTTRP
jgi:hypothetical protein